MGDRVAKQRDPFLKKRGLKVKIVTSILIISVTPLLILLFITQYNTTQLIKDSSGKRLKETAKQASYWLDKAMEQQIEDLQMISISPTVINSLINANHRYGSGSTAYLGIEEANQKWIQAQGTDTIDSDLATKGVGRYLRDYILSRGEEGLVILLFITDQKGALVGTINERPKYFQGDELWWKRTYNDGKGRAYISDIYYDEAIKGYLMDIAITVRGGDSTLGLLKKTLRVKEFFGRSMPGIKAGKTGHLMVIDSKGKIIFCPLLDIGSSISDTRLISSFASPSPAWATVTDDAHGGRDSLIGSAPLEKTNILLQESLPGMGWYTFMWQDPDETYIGTRRFAVWMAIYGLLIIGIIYLIGYIVARRITAPIKRLVEGVDIISKGDLDHYIDIHSNDEIEGLAERFNQIFMDLKNQTASIKETEKRLVDYRGELKKKESEWAKCHLTNTERIISMERFADGIVREVNNHLGIIFGFIQVMLKDCNHNCYSYEEIKIIEKHINYTKKIMEDLLDFARISRLEKEEVDINENIKRAILPLEHELSLGNISLSLNLASDLPKLLCDPKKLQHVYMSLLANAIQVMRNGGVLTISASYDREKNLIELRFKDAGVGISDVDLEKIFDPSYIARGEKEGIGFNLSASYDIIKAHRGEMLVENKGGEGRIFTIFLPINQDSAVVLSDDILRRVKT